MNIENLRNKKHTFWCIHPGLQQTLVLDPSPQGELENCNHHPSCTMRKSNYLSIHLTKKVKFKICFQRHGTNKLPKQVTPGDSVLSNSHDRENVLPADYDQCGYLRALADHLQHPHGRSQPSRTPVPGDLNLFSDPHKHQVHIWTYTYTLWQQGRDAFWRTVESVSTTANVGAFRWRFKTFRRLLGLLQLSKCID